MFGSSYKDGSPWMSTKAREDGRKEEWNREKGELEIPVPSANLSLWGHSGRELQGHSNAWRSTPALDSTSNDSFTHLRLTQDEGKEKEWEKIINSSESLKSSANTESKFSNKNSKLVHHVPAAFEFETPSMASKKTAP